MQTRRNNVIKRQVCIEEDTPSIPNGRKKVGFDFDICSHVLKVVVVFRFAPSNVQQQFGCWGLFI